MSLADGWLVYSVLCPSALIPDWPKHSNKKPNQKSSKRNTHNCKRPCSLLLKKVSFHILFLCVSSSGFKYFQHLTESNFNCSSWEAIPQPNKSHSQEISFTYLLLCLQHFFNLGLSRVEQIHCSPQSLYNNAIKLQKLCAPLSYFHSPEIYGVTTSVLPARHNFRYQ